MMTMGRTAGLLMLSTAALACSGRYEVGGMDAAAGSGAGGTLAVGGTAAASGTTSGFAGNSGVGGGGTNSAGDGMPVDEFGPQCVPTGAPAPLTGAFAQPPVVWSRVAMLIWGKPGPAPAPFPATTTYAWAGDLVDLGFADAKATLNSAPGARLFVAQWLDLGLDFGVDPKFLGDYDSSLPTTSTALAVLLQGSLGEPGRAGVFTEPQWLTRHSSIPSRGSGLLAKLTGQMIPPPPAGVQKPEPDPTMTDRESIEQRTSTQPVCKACHQLMNHAGFALGNFAADASYRLVDHDQPVDTTGSMAVGSEMVMFDGMADLSDQLVDKCQPNLALVDAFLRIAIILAGFPQQQQESLFQGSVDRVRQSFIAGGRSYPALVKAFAQSPAVLRP